MVKTKQSPFALGCKNSAERVKAFIDEFIRSEFMSNWTSEKDSDFWNEPERASRCYDAAENGCDGKTHSEVIEDWREAFSAWVSDRRRGRDSIDPDRFTSAVENHFNEVEAWHEQNGSLFQEIG